MAQVVLKDVTKRWGNVVGVDNQSLDVADKEFLVILGPSGCGKTTTMRMIAGLEQPTSGEIWIGDKMVNDDLPKDRDVAMVFQNYGLYPHMTIFDNIAYPLKVRRTAKAFIQPKVEKVAAQVELTELLHRKPRELSGGQRQRVALARAIVRNPNVFLMDEPLSNLDAKLRLSTRAQIKNLQHELKVTTIYVTHDQIEAMTLADRIVVMDAGVIQQVGTPTEIYERPANTFVAGFIGSPAMNLMEGILEGGVFSAENVRIEGLAGSNDGPATLGFRGEDASIADGAGQITAPVYTMELLGEATMITIRAGGALVSVKAHKDYRVEIGKEVTLSVPNEICHLFDSETNVRIDEGVTQPLGGHDRRSVRLGTYAGRRDKTGGAVEGV